MAEVILIRVSLPWIIDSMSQLDRVKSIPDTVSHIDLLITVLGAKMRLDELLTASIYAQHLRVSVQHGLSLKAEVDRAVEELKSIAAPLPSVRISTLRFQASQFLTILNSELGVIPTFLVLSKEGYDVGLLTENGSRLFPSSTLSKAPETEKDMIEAAKALAFELSTACGFHIYRVLESVIKRYWDHISSGQPRPRLETIGSYAAELKNGKYGDEKIWETLSQIAKLHRNPVIHPEVILSVEEAIETLGIARSAIGAMLRVMPEVPSTTALPV